MKTTVELSEAALENLRRLAEREGTTLRALLEEGARTVIAAHRRKTVFKLRQASFRGKGLRPEIAGQSWATIREMAYDGRS
jgi:hypothetical protein